MNNRLVGPFAFDEKTVLPDTREALAAVKVAIRDGLDDQLRPAQGSRPGLYLLLKGGSDTPSKQLRIRGFWLVFGQSYLAEGPVGPPDKEPPITTAILDAATEEVWWKNLPVDGRGGRWNPLVIMQWPQVLATRSSFAPPGPPPQHDDEDDGAAQEAEDWLQTGPVQAVVQLEEEEDEGGDFQEQVWRYANLPEHRSLLTVVRAKFKHSRTLHQGSFELVPPAAFGEGNDSIPVDEWLDVAAKAKTGKLDDEARRGRPLGTFARDVGFPIAGWLTRTLDLWPPLATDIRVGALTDREVVVRWKAQAWMATTSTVVVLGLVIGFSFAMQMATRPRPKPVAAAPPPAAQPAMSVCSADHEKFVEEFRCQVAHFSHSGDEAVDARACSDKGLTEESDAYLASLQADYCGLRDRSQEKWTAAGAFDFAHLAAAQACFNVLGHPYQYQLPERNGKLLGNPISFLEDQSLKSQPLVDLVTELDAACETYRTRLESRVEGAVFATHVGSSGTPSEDNEAAALRAYTVGVAMVGSSNDAQQCFLVGMDRGVEGDRYTGVCSADGKTADRVDRGFDESKIWQELSGPTEGVSLINRYVSARFGAEKEDLTDLWQCHERLVPLTEEGARKPRPDRVMGMWDIPIPIPTDYSMRGAGARSQLVLDASLKAMADGADPGPCWSVVGRKLASYTPVHPILGPLDEGGWPSAEQQLCGQICAAAYQVTPANAPDWVTPRGDLGQCLTTRQPGDTPDMGRGVLDRLRVPWSFQRGRRGEWIEPTASQICAFNIIAQDRFPVGDDGYIIGGRSPEQWAGETGSGSGIAGGPEGLVTHAVSGMSRYGAGSAWSKGSCGHVSLQCFSSVMLDVLGDEDYERYDWVQAWKRNVELLSRERPSAVAEKHPWCAPIHDYLSVNAATAQFDAPCREGVELSRQHVDETLNILANGGAQ